MAKRSILETYALAMCFVTAVTFVFTSGFLLYDIVRVVSPGFTLDRFFAERYADNNTYWEHERPRCYEGRTQNCGDSAVRPPEGDLTKRRSAGLALEQSGERRRGWQGLVQNLLLVLVNIAVFGLHWRIARRAREQNGLQPSSGQSFVNAAQAAPG